MFARNFSTHELLTPLHRDMTASGMLGAGMLGKMVFGTGSGPLVWSAEASLTGLIR